MPKKSCCRVMMGPLCTHATECPTGSLVGADFGIERELSDQLPEEWWQPDADFCLQELPRG